MRNTLEQRIQPEVDRFDDEGGAMTPTTPVAKADVYSDNSPMVLAYALVAFSGFLMGLLATWIF